MRVQPVHFWLWMTHSMLLIYLISFSLFFLDAAYGSTLWQTTAPDYASFSLPFINNNILYITVQGNISACLRFLTHQGAILPYLLTMDITRPAAPTILSKYMLAMPAYSLVYYENNFYAMEYGFIEAINISDPKAPSQKWKVTIETTNGINNLAISCGVST